jgi:hypothetical protein
VPIGRGNEGDRIMHTTELATKDLRIVHFVSVGATCQARERSKQGGYWIVCCDEVEVGVEEKKLLWERKNFNLKNRNRASRA